MLRLQGRGAVPLGKGCCASREGVCCASREGVLFFMSFFIKLWVKKEKFKKINIIFFFRELFFILLHIFIFQVFSPFNWLYFLKLVVFITSIFNLNSVCVFVCLSVVVTESVTR